MRSEPEQRNTDQLCFHESRAEVQKGGEKPILEECVGVAGKAALTFLRF